ncbi:MAG: YdcH family protein [Geminicoccaceae bacterium]
MSMQDYLESLKSKHASLERAINEEMLRPAPDSLQLSRLKREKLKIKEQIGKLQPAEERELATVH